MGDNFCHEKGIHWDLPRVPDNACLFESHIDWEVEEKKLEMQEKSEKTDDFQSEK